MIYNIWLSTGIVRLMYMVSALFNRVWNRRVVIASLIFVDVFSLLAPHLTSVRWIQDFCRFITDISGFYPQFN